MKGREHSPRVSALPASRLLSLLPLRMKNTILTSRKLSWGNSSQIKDLKKAATQTVTSMTLDPNPPEDYMKQPDWYGTLTPPAKMSDERLLAEYENIQKVMDEEKRENVIPT